MDLKKSHKANLERRQGGRFFLGLLISLSLILISFEWTTISTKLEAVHAASEIQFDVEEMDHIRREKLKPPLKPILPPLTPIIKAVDEELPMPEIDWSTEVTPDTKYVFENFPPDEPEVIEPEPDIFFVEIMPTFNGGDPKVEFFKYILKNLHYPESAVENNISGRVVVKFVINDRGELVKAQIYHSVHPDLDNEALRVVNSSPRWEPGIQSGRRVDVTFIFPISFKLQ